MFSACNIFLSKEVSQVLLEPRTFISALVPYMLASPNAGQMLEHVAGYKAVGSNPNEVNFLFILIIVTVRVSNM